MAAAVNLPDPRVVVVEADSPTLTVSHGLWFNLTDETLYTGGSYKLTNTAGAVAELAFTGSEVWFYADKNIDHGNFNATIDDGAPTTVSGNSDRYLKQFMLFYAQVEPGEHVLKLTNLEPKMMGIDYFAYMPVQSSSGAAPGASSTLPLGAPGTPPAAVLETPTASKHAPNGLIVGLALGLTVAVLALVLVILLFLSCRRKRRTLAASRRQELEPMAYRPNSISSGSVESGEPLVLTNPLPSLWSASSSARRVRHAVWGESELASSRFSTHYSTVLGDATMSHYSTVVGDATTIQSPLPTYAAGSPRQFDHTPALPGSSKGKIVH